MLPAVTSHRILVMSGKHMLSRAIPCGAEQHLGLGVVRQVPTPGSCQCALLSKPRRAGSGGRRYRLPAHLISRHNNRSQIRGCGPAPHWVKQAASSRFGRRDSTPGLPMGTCGPPARGDLLIVQPFRVLFGQGTGRRDEGEASCHRHLRHHTVPVLAQPKLDLVQASDLRMPRKVFLTPVKKPCRGILVFPTHRVPQLESLQIHVAQLSGETRCCQARCAHRHTAERHSLFRGGETCNWKTTSQRPSGTVQRSLPGACGLHLS